MKSFSKIDVIEEVERRPLDGEAADARPPEPPPNDASNSSSA